MVSSNEAGFNLRERGPLSQTLRKALQRLMGQRTNPMVCHRPKGCRDWLDLHTSPKADTGYLNYPVSVRDTAKSGKGCDGNRHLSHLAESNIVNVGDSHRNAKVSSPPMFDADVGAAIVVRAWESQAQGEGPQSVGTF
jgi:hypothetical protein